MEISGLNQSGMDEAIVRRFSVLILRVLERARGVSGHGVDWRDVSGLYTGYRDFWKRYALVNSFRDMAIVDGLFLESLFHGPLPFSSKPENRNAIYRDFLLQKLRQDGRLAIDEARNALNMLEAKCREEYDGMHGPQVFAFNEDDLASRRIPPSEKKNLFDALVDSRLLEDKKGRLTFTLSWMNSYFYSTALAEVKNPSQLTEALLSNNFYSGTEIVPFLVGQNPDAVPALSAILSGLEERGPQYAQGYVRENFDVILASVSPTPTNEKFIATLSQKLPETLRPTAPYIGESVKYYQEAVGAKASALARPAGSTR